MLHRCFSAGEVFHWNDFCTGAPLFLVLRFAISIYTVFLFLHKFGNIFTWAQFLSPGAMNSPAHCKERPDNRSQHHHDAWHSWHAGRKGCLPEGLWQAGELGLCKHHDAQKGQVEGPAHSLGQAQVQAGQGMDQQQSCGERLGRVCVEKLNLTQQSTLAAHKANHIPSCIKRAGTSGSREVCLPLSSALWTPHLEHCVQLGAPNMRDVNLFEQVQRGVTK